MTSWTWSAVLIEIVKELSDGHDPGCDQQSEGCGEERVQDRPRRDGRIGRDRRLDDAQEVRCVIRRVGEEGRIRRTEGDQPALECRQLRVLGGGPLGLPGERLDARLDRVDLFLRRPDVGVDRRLELDLLTLDAGRRRDELLGHGVGDRRRDVRVDVLRRDGQERAVERSVGVHPRRQLAGSRLQAELLDHGVEDRAPGGDVGIGGREPLRDEDLRIVGAHGRQRLTDDQGGLGLVHLRKCAADEVADGCRHDDADRQKRKPCSDDRDLAPEVHAVSIFLLPGYRRVLTRRRRRRRRRPSSATMLGAVKCPHSSVVPCGTAWIPGTDQPDHRRSRRLSDPPPASDSAMRRCRAVYRSHTRYAASRQYIAWRPASVVAGWSVA